MQQTNLIFLFQGFAVRFARSLSKLRTVFGSAVDVGGSLQSDHSKVVSRISKRGSMILFHIFSTVIWLLLCFIIVQALLNIPNHIFYKEQVILINWTIFFLL